MGGSGGSAGYVTRGGRMLEEEAYTCPVVLTVEYSVRGAIHAVYGLDDHEIPAVHHAPLG